MRRSPGPAAFYRLDLRAGSDERRGGLGLFAGLATIEQNTRASLPNDPLSHLKASNRRLSVVYGWGSGTDPILLVETAAEREALGAQAERAAEDAAVVRRILGVPGPDHLAPVFLGCRLGPSGDPEIDLRSALSAPAVSVPGFWPRLGGLVSNHLTSMFHVALALDANRLGGLALDVAALAALATKVRGLSRKDQYVALAQGAAADADLPLVATVVLDVHGLVEQPPPRWPLLRAVLDQARDEGPVVLKPSVSGGGDGITIVPPGDEATLERGLRLVAQHSPCVLVQDLVVPPADQGLPARVGASLFIDAAGRVQILGVAQQLFRDPLRHGCAASHWSAAAERQVLDGVGDGLRSRGGALAGAGLRGPFGLDLVLDGATGRYVDVADLNPRLTGSGPLWMCRDLLERSGTAAERITALPLDSIGPLGLDGLVGLARRLDRSGALLTARRPQGVWMVPSLGGPAHVHAFAVNVDGRTAADLHRLLAGLLGARPERLFG